MVVIIPDCMYPPPGILIQRFFKNIYKSQNIRVILALIVLISSFVAQTITASPSPVNPASLDNSNPGMPSILEGPIVQSHHRGNDLGVQSYAISFNIKISDPDGLSDIESVKISGPTGTTYILSDNNNDGWYENWTEGSSAPPPGIYSCLVTDKSSLQASASGNMTAIMDYPKNVKPANNSTVASATPVFVWDEVPGAIRYYINVSDVNWTRIWDKDGFTSTSISFNADGTATGNLVQGTEYFWSITAYDANGNQGSQERIQFVYSSNTVKPVLINPAVWSGHFGNEMGYNEYAISTQLTVFDPQGINDIASVKVTTPGGTVYSMQDNENDGTYNGWVSGLSSPPATGSYIFRVTDKSGNWNENVDILTSNLDFPKNVNPGQGKLISSLTPVISWDSVPGAVKYQLWINKTDGPQIWWGGDLTSTSVIFNYNGTASENLVSGAFYYLAVRAIDAEGNWGEQNSILFGYSSSTVLPVMNSARISSRHWSGGNNSESWGLDCSVFIADPQGLADIDSAWIDGPSNFHIKLFDDGKHNDNSLNDGKFGYFLNGLVSPPSTGEYIFKALDKSGHVVQEKDTVKRVLDIPGNIVPKTNSIISNPDFTISWDAVKDATEYDINVNSLDWSKNYWYSGRKPMATSQIYNSDNTGTELTDGGVYYLTVRASDGPGGNESENSSVKIAFRTNNRKTVYVDSSNISANHTGTRNFPFNDLAEAVNASITGDTVKVSKGTYKSRIGDLGSITLLGENPVNTIIQGFLGLRSTDVHVEGFTVRDSAWSGIEIHENVKAKISNNIISGFPGAGIVQSWNGASSAVITNNTIVNNGVGISLESDGSNSLISNNIIAFNRNGISRTGNATVNNTYNCYYNVSNGPFDLSNLSKGEGDISEDPEFAGYSKGDFRLKPVSPCIDKGNPDLDGDGKSWEEDADDRNPDTTRLDMGALHLDQRTLYPDIPAELKAVSCNNLVTLSWKSNTGLFFSRYRIYADTKVSPVTKIDSTIGGISVNSKIISGLTKGTTYFFRITGVNAGGKESDFSDQASAAVQTGAVPKIKIKWKGNGDVLICYNLGDSITTWQWYKNGTQISGATGQYYVADKQTGEYSVNTIDKNLCKNSSNILAVTGTSALSIYPNPVVTSFALKINDESQGRVLVSIMNSMGNKVMELEAESKDDEILTEIPVYQLKKGIYYLKVLVNNTDLYTEKIVVVK
jgi:hypothetical protein